jgi:hypothetical protein
MTNRFSTSEIVELIIRGGKDYEVWAAAEGEYDEAGGELRLHLDAFQKLADIRAREELQRPAWLPKPQTVREKVPREEATELAREIFQRWVGRVRQAIPSHIAE